MKVLNMMQIKKTNREKSKIMNNICILSILKGNVFILSRVQVIEFFYKNLFYN